MCELKKLNKEEVRGHWRLAMPDMSGMSGSKIWCFGDYHSGEGFEKTPMNQLILNLKIFLTETNRIRHKHKAIQKIATFMKGHYEQFSSCVFVPVPPSGEGSQNNNQGDTRLEMILRKTDLHWAKIVQQTQSYEASHLTNVKKSPDELLKIYSINKKEASKIKDSSKIVVFDDILTTGAHFIAMAKKLREHFSSNRQVGMLCIAHTVRPPEFDALPSE